MVRKLITQLCWIGFVGFGLAKLTPISNQFFDWHWSLTWPEREQRAREFFKRAFGKDGER